MNLGDTEPGNPQSEDPIDLDLVNESMRQWYADRLIKTMDTVADHAAASGLTEAGIEALLDEES
jgi:hypothetical protein